MAQATDVLSEHRQNISAVLRRALHLAELAGECRDPVRRHELIHECMLTWRAAQRLRRYPNMQARP
jgi:hypothetical protein